MKIKLADHHAHIVKEYYDDPLSEVKRLFENGIIEHLVCVGTEFDSNKEILELSKKFNNKDFLKVGLGIHPEQVINLGNFSDQELGRVVKQINENIDLIDYIGEIGIDFSYPDSKKFKKEQIDTFKTLLKLAKENKKPVSIHARDAFEEIIEIVDEIGFDTEVFNGFLHCFTGDFEQGLFFIENGFKLGIGGIITYPKAENLRNTVKELLDFYSDKDFNDLFGLETDSPYLSPEPNRSEKNNPENVKIIADFIAKNIL
jgi:TatD DNase family protein